MTCPDCASERESRLRAERERDEALEAGYVKGYETALEHHMEQLALGLAALETRAALSSLAVTAEGKKLGEEKVEAGPSSTWTLPDGSQAVSRDWMCPDCKHQHAGGWGGICVGCACPRTAPDEPRAAPPKTPERA